MSGRPVKGPTNVLLSIVTTCVLRSPTSTTLHAFMVQQ